MNSVTQGMSSEAAYQHLRYTFIQQRELQNLTQTALAGRMGITQSAMSELETGVVKNPGIMTIFRWASALSVDLSMTITCVVRTTIKVIPSPNEKPSTNGA